MSIGIEPLGEMVLIELEQAAETTASGFMLPEAAREKMNVGTVVAAGPGKVSDSGKAVAMEVKKGDRILYGKYSGTEFSFEGTEYLIMRESDILAVL